MKIILSEYYIMPSFSTAKEERSSCHLPGDGGDERYGNDCREYLVRGILGFLNEIYVSEIRQSCYPQYPMNR
jgi:hypothetical protein